MLFPYNMLISLYEKMQNIFIQCSQHRPKNCAIFLISDEKKKVRIVIISFQNIAKKHFSEFLG